MPWIKREFVSKVRANFFIGSMRGRMTPVHH